MESGDDLRTIHSGQPFERVVERARDAIRGRGLTLFVEIDHARNAREAGLAMPATRVLIFGSGKAGTPLMLLAPDIALDLPLRILIRSEQDGTTAVVYRDPEQSRCRVRCRRSRPGPRRGAGDRRGGRRLTSVERSRRYRLRGCGPPPTEDRCRNGEDWRSTARSNTRLSPAARSA